MSMFGGIGTIVGGIGGAMIGGPAGAMAGAAIGGNLGGGIDANSANVDMNRETRTWSQYMSNTAHQREVADLRSAGLNPMLSVNAGASTPSSQAPVVENVGKGLGSAIDAQNMMQGIKESNSKIALNGAAKAAQESAAVKDLASAKQAQSQTKSIDLQMGAIEGEAGVRKQQSEWDRNMMKFDNVSKRIQSGLGIGNSAKDLLNPFIKKPPSDVKPWQGRTKSGTKYDRGTGEIIP